MADPGLGLPHARIASGDSFVACPDAAADLAALGATLVDMEVGAVAQVAARLGKPWAAIKAVTDEANNHSAGDFHPHLVRAARAAAGDIARLLARRCSPAILLRRSPPSVRGGAFRGAPGAAPTSG